MSGVSAHAPDASPVLGGNQLFLGCGFLTVQLFQFLFMGAGSFLNHGKNKNDQLFTVDRLCFGHYFCIFKMKIHPLNDYLTRTMT